MNRNRTTASAHGSGPAMIALSLAILMASLGTSIANVGLPALADSFDAPFRQVQWVVLAYLLSITALIVGVGRLGDLLGRRRVLVAGIAIFTVASLACGVAPSLESLVAARAAQGLGAAILMALGVAFVRDAVPAEQTGRAMGLMGTMSAVGTALGPSLGGLLIAAGGWRAIFLVNLPLGAAALVLALRTLPAGARATSATRFDIAGTVVLAATLAAYTLAVTSSNAAPLIAVAVVGLAVFLVVESRSASPLIRLDTFRDPVLSTGLGMSALVSTVVMATLVVGPFYLTRALGLSVAATGAVMTVGPAVAALTSPIAGRLTDRLGTHRLIVAGLTAMAVGSAAFSVLPLALGAAAYIAAIAVLTAGYAAFQTANNTSVMKDVAADRRGVVSGMLNLSRNLGLITGASVMGAVFAFASHSGDVGTASAGALAGGLHGTFRVAGLVLLVALGVAVGVRSWACRRDPDCDKSSTRFFRMTFQNS